MTRDARRARSLTYAAAALALTVLVWAVAAWMVVEERERRAAESVEQARRIALFFERQTLATFRYGDAYLKMVRREYQKGASIEDIRDMIRDVPLDDSLVSHLTIIDAEGTPVLNSGHPIKAGTSAADRDYFLRMQGEDADELFISLPNRGRNSGKLILRLVRRLLGPAGEFDGVAFVALEAEKVTEFFDAMNVGPDSSATLVGNDKRIRARSSYGRLGPGQDISGSRLWRELEQAPAGVYQQTSVVDGITRHYAYRQLAEFPLVVAIGVAEGDIDRGVIAFQIPTYLIASLVTALILTMTVTFARETRARRELAAGEARVRTVVETVLDGIVTVGSDGRIQGYSHGAEAILGYAPQEVVGRHVSALGPESGPDGLDAAVAEWLSGDGIPPGRQGFREVRARRKDGVEFPAEVAVGAMRDANERLLVCTIRDITERVEAERTIRDMRDQLEVRVRERTAELEVVQEELLRKERLAALGQLTGTVAHELRNPLSTIATSTAVIARRLGADRTQVKATIERLKRNVERCNGIVTELLDYARTSRPAIASTPLDEWLPGVLEELERPGGPTLTLALDAAGVNVHADRDRVRRAVVNLVENARDATMKRTCDGRPPAVRVATSRVGDRVLVEVSDNGPGIPDDVREKILEPLFSTKSFGVGLGLPVVSQIMDEHGGGLEITSDPGGGTRARMWFPVPEVAEAS